MKKYLSFSKNIVILAITFSVIFQSPTLLAANCSGGTFSSFKNSATKCLDDAGDTTNKNSLFQTIKDVINVLLFVAGVAAVIIMVIGGFRFVTSDGDSNSVSKAKNSIIYAVIGLALCASAYTIVNFVLGRLG